MSVLEKVTFNFSLSNNYQLIKLLLSPDHWICLLFELDSESPMSQHCAKHVGTVTTDLLTCFSSPFVSACWEPFCSFKGLINSKLE